MSPFLFYYTLCILLVSIMASAVCFSSYLVSRYKKAAYAAISFAFYFFDVALVFQDDYLVLKSHDPYVIGSPFFAILTGYGILQAFWLVYCHILTIEKKVYRWAPGVVFIAGSLLIYFLLPTGGLREFLFYSMRAVFFFFILSCYVIGVLREQDSVKKSRLLRYSHFQNMLWILGTLVVIENVYFLLYLNPEQLASFPYQFLPERNFAENVLFLYCAIGMCAKEIKYISMRFDKPPINNTDAIAMHINKRIDYFAQSNGLSPRETEVLELVLKGFTNQEIATQIVLANSTVKVHVHNILKKCDVSGRHELLQLFWMQG